MRSMFNVHFMAMVVTGVIATSPLPRRGDLVSGLGIGLVTAFAVSSFRWFLRQMDAQLSARAAGDVGAVRQLRRLHWGGMLSNALQLAVIVPCIPYMAVVPT